MHGQVQIFGVCQFYLIKPTVALVNELTTWQQLLQIVEHLEVSTGLHGLQGASLIATLLKIHQASVWEEKIAKQFSYLV